LFHSRDVALTLGRHTLDPTTSRLLTRPDAPPHGLPLIGHGLGGAGVELMG
jgi:hypothetical protein